MTVAERPALARTGSLTIAASHDGRRTVVDTLRQEGLCRSSRPFAEMDGGARLVTAHLGPGFVRGDRFTLDVTLAPGARLTLAAQAAARALGAGAPSHSDATLRLARGASIAVLGEPLVTYDGASHIARTAVTLADGAAFAWLDCFAPHGAFVAVTTSLRVSAGGRLAVHDVLHLTPARLSEAIGSAYYVRAGMSARRSEELVATADAVAERARDNRDLTLGIGSPTIGGVALRARGPRAADLRAVLLEVLAAVRAGDAADEDT